MLIAITAVMTYEADAQPRCIYADMARSLRLTSRGSVAVFGAHREASRPTVVSMVGVELPVYSPQVLPARTSVVARRIARWPTLCLLVVGLLTAILLKLRTRLRRAGLRPRFRLSRLSPRLTPTLSWRSEADGAWAQKSGWMMVDSGRGKPERRPVSVRHCRTRCMWPRVAASRRTRPLPLANGSCFPLSYVDCELTASRHPDRGRPADSDGCAPTRLDGVAAGPKLLAGAPARRTRPGLVRCWRYGVGERPLMWSSGREEDGVSAGQFSAVR